MIRAVLAVLIAVPCFILLIPAFVATGVLITFASVARSVGRLLEPTSVPWTELMMFDERLGWKPRPNLDAYYLAPLDDVHHVVTDGDGWPGRRSIAASRVIVIGDSFAFGYGVDTCRSFAEVDASLPVKAIGAPGYSMVHGVLLMEQFGARLAGKLVVWFVYLENDLQDNLAPEMRGYRAPFLRTNATSAMWAIFSGHLSPAKWTCSYQDSRRLFPHLCVPGPLADRAYSACDYLIERAEAACRQVGARLAVVTIPHPMQLTSEGVRQLAVLSGRPDACDEDLPDRRLAECCQRHAVPMVIGKQHLSHADYKRREGIHWNEQGHRRMSAVVRRLAESAGVAQTGSPTSTASAMTTAVPGRDLVAPPKGSPA